MDCVPPLLQNLVWLKGDWCYPSRSKETDSLLRECVDVTVPSNSGDDSQLVEELMANSDKFPIAFPVENVRLRKLKELAPEINQARNIASTYPLIHERVLLLAANFIVYMREFGTPLEKALYVNMTIPDFFDRLLLKRSVTFCGPRDTYKLLSGEEGNNGWESVGTATEKPPLTLSACLSYSEMRVSAMLFVSGRTTFVNDGARTNEGRVLTDRQTEGVIIGLIGTRLERKFHMEYEELLITAQQNRLELGFGEEVSPRTCLDVLKTAYVRDSRIDKYAWRQMWSEFYQVPSYLYEELSPRMQQPSEKPPYAQRFVLIPNTTDIFDNELYYKRLSIPFDCALLDADCRAKEDGKMAFLNIVGIGLGVWKVSPHQTDVFVLSFLDRLRLLLARGFLHNVADVNFAYIKPGEDITEMLSKCRRMSSAEHPHGGVAIHRTNREPAATLSGEHAAELLVTTYAWDGNAHPGNEFWLGSLSTSGDPAAACSSQVAELHNAHINTRYVRASNLRVAGARGMHTLPEYCRLLSDKQV